MFLYNFLTLLVFFKTDNDQSYNDNLLDVKFAIYIVQSFNGR